ncbi:MAG TPA: hypothetical protein VKG23_08980 [Thermoanaerobaculia bacterium]|nr:hypothetical protein [Thermoanaerobaculia bacterium]
MRREGMARRGAPDKNEKRVAQAVVMACPSCSSELRLEPEWLEGETDLLCGRCETEIPLAPARESGLGF